MSRKLLKEELDFVFELAEGMCGAYGEDSTGMRDQIAAIRRLQVQDSPRQTG